MAGWFVAAFMCGGFLFLAGYVMGYSDGKADRG